MTDIPHLHERLQLKALHERQWLSAFWAERRELSPHQLPRSPSARHYMRKFVEQVDAAKSGGRRLSLAFGACRPACLGTECEPDRPPNILSSDGADFRR